MVEAVTVEATTVEGEISWLTSASRRQSTQTVELIKMSRTLKFSSRVILTS